MVSATIVGVGPRRRDGVGGGLVGVVESLAAAITGEGRRLVAVPVAATRGGHA